MSIKGKIDNAIGQLFLRMEARARRIQQEQRRLIVAQNATFDATAALGPLGTVTNNQSRRDAIKVGRSSYVSGHLMVFPLAGNITIGEHCFIGPESRVWSARSVTIGKYVLVSHNVNIHDCNGHSRDWKERRQEIDDILPSMRAYDIAQEIGARPIVIEDDVWIGYNAVVRPGVTIGARSIIGAHTVVTRDVPCDSVVVGNPAKNLKTHGSSNE